MSTPQVVIVGRPNVGKSSVFNWLAQKRLAIVDDMAGVTRDRMSFLLEHGEHHFELVDTGGMGIQDADHLNSEIENQIAQAIEAADVVLFVADIGSGLVPLDREVAKRLRPLGKPILFVANKADSARRDPHAEEFHSLGMGMPLCVSAKANRNREELLNQLVAMLPPGSICEDAAGEPVMKVAIVGRRNVGKSTFVNQLAKAERMIVSEVPGTTRDSVDVRFESDGKAFIAIDTPGLRRSKSVRSNVDFYGTHRARRSIRRADVVLLFFDSIEEIGRVDKQLTRYISDQYKPCIFVVNKWDLLRRKASTGQWGEYLRATFPTMSHVPIAFITARTGKNVRTLLNHAQMLFKQSRQRVPTGPLNALIEKAIEHHPPAMHQNRRPKIYYATQVGVQPPTIVLMCSNPKAFSADYRRYLLGVLREHFPFAEVPIRLFLDQRRGEDRRSGKGSGKWQVASGKGQRARRSSEGRGKGQGSGKGQGARGKGPGSGKRARGK